jgi:hypothetical protein
MGIHQLGTLALNYALLVQQIHYLWLVTCSRHVSFKFQNRHRLNYAGQMR